VSEAPVSPTPTPTPTPAKTSRPRPLFLGLAVLAVALIAAYFMWPATSPHAAPSNQPRAQQQAPAQPGAAGARKPGDLNVRLGELQQPPPSPSEADRNPFRFKPKPPPPPPPPPPQPINVAPPPPPQGAQPPVPIGPPPPPPITLKFIGTMEQGNRRVAIFSDGKGLPLHAAEGGVVLGQYRVVKIGVESVTMEYLDGRGRQQIPMRGQ
jgi:hypothetical protein